MTPASSNHRVFSGEPCLSCVSGVCDKGEFCGDGEDACAPEPADALARWLSKFGMKSDMLETFPPQVYLISCYSVFPATLLRRVVTGSWY